jgi:hypothetical protein
MPAQQEAASAERAPSATVGSGGNRHTTTPAPLIGVPYGGCEHANADKIRLRHALLRDACAHGNEDMKLMNQLPS